MAATETSFAKRLFRHWHRDKRHYALHAQATRRTLWTTAFVICALILTPPRAATLPEDQLDVDYHFYDGGGVEVSGPALTARKTFRGSMAVHGGYYVDSISSASVDVVTTASPYDDRRDEVSLGGDYLYGDTLMSMTGIASTENDYDAVTLDASISQTLWTGTTTLTLGYKRGWDEVSRVDTDFSADVDRHNYRVGLTQMVSPTLRLGLDYEAISDRGYLANPYRSARLLGATVPERYPGTRTSNALALRGVNYIARDTSVRLDYRYFWDTWSIGAHTIEAGFNRYLGTRFLGELRYRYYTQSEASFYSDNFIQEKNYMSRDKELARFTGHTLGFTVTYRLSKPAPPSSWGDHSIGVSYDFLTRDYDNFTDLRSGQLYSVDANVLQFLYSLRF